MVLAEPHRRYNALTDEWVLVLGRTHAPAVAGPPRPSRAGSGSPATTRAATCARATRGRTASPTPGTRTPSSSPTISPPCDPTVPRRASRKADLLRAEGERGTCRVLCFSPRHDLTIGRMTSGRPCVASSTCGPSTRPSSAGRTAGCRSSRTAARPWARRTRIRTARSGPARPSRSQAVREDATQLRWCDRTGQRLLLAYAAQEHGGPRGRGGERRLARGRALLGGLAVRDAGPAAAARSAACRTWERRNATPWRPR